jgi:hypothetical protein
VQDGLLRPSECLGCLFEPKPPGRCFRYQPKFELIGYADSPRCGWHDLARLNKALPRPTTDRVGADAQFSRGLIDVLPFRAVLKGSGTRRRAWNAEPRAQWRYTAGGECIVLAGAQASGIQNERNLLVAVVWSESSHEVQHLGWRYASILPNPIES